MTNRRSFLGLLAAAPFVAPVVAKEMAQVAVTPNAMRVAVGLSPIFVGDDALIGSRIYEGPWLYDVNQRYRRWHWTWNSDGSGFGFQVEDETPNRLYGAQINSDGEAV